MKIFLSLFAVALMTIASNAQALKNKDGLSLKESFDGYLNAIKARDLDAVKTFVIEKDSIQFVDAGGKPVALMDQYLKQVEGFLLDTPWTYNSELLSLKQYGNMGIVMEKVELVAPTWSFPMVVSYVFTKEGKQWRMAGDFCTHITN